VLLTILESLECPVCRGDLRASPGTVHCDLGHSYDVAKEGYVNLLAGDASTGTADTPAMVAARREFLAAGYFSRIAEAVVSAVQGGLDEATTGILVDAGGGTGEYLRPLLERLPGQDGLSIDVSKHAARFAARIHPRAAAIVTDVWSRLPLKDSSAAVILSIFAPRNAEEFARVLADDGLLLVVTPTQRHLGEIVEPLGLLAVDPDKDERLAAKLGPHFTKVAAEQVEYVVTMPRADAVTAASMGPAAMHASEADLATRGDALDDVVGVTVSVNVRTFSPRTIDATA